MSVYIFFIWYLAGRHLSHYSTIEIRYYQPLEAVTEDYFEEDLHFVLQCNAQRSLFFSAPGLPVVSSGLIRGGAQSLKAEDLWIVKDLANSQIIQQARSIQGNPYIIEDLIHPMQWIILDKTRVIAGRLVQKAQCNYRGRAFTAWFAPSIPLDNGPWKLGGLPGLILEAYDEEREVVFLFRSLKRIGRKTLDKPAFPGQKIGLKTYLELNKKELQQYLDLLEYRLQQLRADIHLELHIGKLSSWEYPE